MYVSFNARALGSPLSAEETVALAARAGFEGVDLLIRDLVEAGEQPREIAARIEERGLRAGAFPLPVRWRNDAATYRRELAELPRFAEVAAELGFRRTGTWVLPQTPDELGTDPDFAAVARFHHDRLGPIASCLAGFGIRLGLEAIGSSTFRAGPGPAFVTRLDELEPRLGPLERLGPNVGLLVDSFHAYAADESIESILERPVENVVWVHVADLPKQTDPDRSTIVDSDRGLPGEHGAIDSARLLAGLQMLGYDGPVTLEPLSGCRSLQGLDPEARAVAAMAAWLEIRPAARLPQ
ncbi:MAG: sugar phosphate isomerase/epimerase family protein [Isosphaeraceae bacterium]|nr:sugar phosphate isomerase/epimerase family protein [Isosphaeraceae bacterium]